MFSRSAVSRLVAEDGRKHASASSRCAIGPMRRCRPVATRRCSAPCAWVDAKNNWRSPGKKYPQVVLPSPFEMRCNAEPSVRITYC